MFYHSPLGLIKLKSSGANISELLYVEEETDNEADSFSAIEKKVLQKCLQQLDEYFSGKRIKFDVAIEQQGTVFQQKVWKELLSIPFGKTITYYQLAHQVGDVKSIRAAASANGKNKINIIVPCHRVIGTNGSLTGYAGGLPRKKWLLDHENKYANGVSLLF